jgi:hypothetical protein
VLKYLKADKSRNVDALWRFLVLSEKKLNDWLFCLWEYFLSNTKLKQILNKGYGWVPDSDEEVVYKGVGWWVGPFLGFEEFDDRVIKMGVSDFEHIFE